MRFYFYGCINVVEGIKNNANFSAVFWIRNLKWLQVDGIWKTQTSNVTEPPITRLLEKREDSELPPPPARHFDPSRFGGGGETQVADTAKPSQSKFDQYGMRIDDSAKEASDMASKGFSFPKETVEKLNAKPMRKPYGLDDLDGDEILAKAENEFNLNSANLKNKFENATSTASSQLSSAQQDFRSAMSSASSSGSTTKNPSTSESNSFASGDNSFAASPIAKTIDTAKGFGSVSGGSFLPKTNAFDNVKQASAESASAINGALYDAKGRLASATSSLGGQAQSDVDSMKSQFEQRLLAAQKQAEAKSDAFKSGTLKASDQLSALANVSPRTQELINQPFPKVAEDGSFIPQKSGRPADLNASLPNLQPTSNTPLQVSKPNALAVNSFSGTPSANDDSISKMRSEIALLKAQVAAAKQSAVAATQPVPQVAQNTIEGIVLPLDKVNDAFDPRAGKPIVNQYQGQPYSPSAGQPRAPIAPSNNFNTGGDSNSFYPSTPHGGFGSTSKPKATVGQVGFSTANDFKIKSRKPTPKNQLVFTRAHCKPLESIVRRRRS